MNNLNMVFNEVSNKTCNNSVFSSHNMSRMHITTQRLYEAAKELKGITGQSELARQLNATPQTVKNWESRGVSKSGMLDAERLLGCSASWIETGAGSLRIGATSIGGTARMLTLSDPSDGVIETGAIEYWNAKGSCGGGFQNHDELPKGHLVKEISFFKRYGLKPENAFAIYADGSSMADFIVDGDIVIFDKSKTDPQSGKIFAIDHPDGLRIKMLRRGIDGSWVLESNNIDKRSFPDERITPEQGELLKIHGQFVYRQGG